jgi:hypothetical protein
LPFTIPLAIIPSTFRDAGADDAQSLNDRAVNQLEIDPDSETRDRSVPHGKPLTRGQRGDPGPAAGPADRETGKVYRDEIGRNLEAIAWAGEGTRKIIDEFV